MFHQLVNHNDDISRLVNKGYAVAFDSNCLIIRDIPYLNSELSLQTGAIVTKLVFIDEYHVTQDDHQIYFDGTAPYNLDGKPIPNLGGGPFHLHLSDNCKDVVVQRSFSNKPKTTGKFQDFFEKIENYVAIISGPAMELFEITPYTFHVVEEDVTDQIFKLHDTLTSRAELTDLAKNFHNDVIAVIGLGGTGGYLLDFLVKTPVKEIRIFDLDNFYVHNAFRSPGKLDQSEFGKPKVDVYFERYDNFRNGLTINRKFLDMSCGDDLKGVTFAFICIDKGSCREGIINLLISMEIPFIDVGMGINRKRGNLNGLLRATYFSAEQGRKIYGRGLVQLGEEENDEYKTNIQISELNALNACLAIIKFKQLRGFYYEEFPYYNLAFDIGDLKIVGEYNIDED